MVTCAHAQVQLTPSPFAEVAGFVRPDIKKRIAATAESGRVTQRKTAKEHIDDEATTFPGPLVLPWDDLNIDPESPTQSFRSWLKEKERNKPTKRRSTIYFVRVPEISEDVEFMRAWTKPNVNATSNEKGQPAKKKVRVERNGNTTEIEELEDLQSPDAEEFVEYLGSFYHGFTIRQLPPLRWTSWSTPSTSKSKRAPSRASSRNTSSTNLPSFVGLALGTKCTRIRVRPSKDGIFPAQLNLNDISDHLISILPSDAYSVVLLVDHDLYEGDDDDFCCGLAYGGSRICTVQTARYV